LAENNKVNRFFSEDIQVIVKYIPKVLLFLLPIFILFAVPLSIFLWTGEDISVSKIIQLQWDKNRTALYGKAYSYSDPLYKWESVKLRNPSIIALGSSRVLPFRSKFFKDSSSFFNAGLAVTGIEGFNTFLSDIPIERQPQLIIMGLDQKMFYSDLGIPYFYRTEDPIFTQFLTRSWRQIYLDIFQRKFTFKDLLAQNAEEYPIGILARIRHNGYRNDGSYQYGDTRMQSFEERKKLIDIDARAITATHCVQYQDTLVPETLESLARFLKTARERNIIVVGFIPPYAQELLVTMRSFPDSICAQQINKLPIALSTIFTEYHFEFFDFTDNASFGGSDLELEDSVHAGEKSYLRFFIKMLKNGQALKPYADLGFLERRLKNATSDLDVFYYEY